MKIYLVGGAVRDQLLNYPVRERDWVVVGSTPQHMLDSGYKPVGKDFPVFLHPHSNEEYALARTERKSGHGYTGFTFHTDPSVSLEDDLIRRDLSINAIALSDDGEFIDPYGGRADIEARILRHVSPAFIEDPVRILRVARFAARYHHLGFSIADETLALMQSMVENGEIDHLVPERVWQEIKKCLSGDNPHVFFQTLSNINALQKLLPELAALFGVTQASQYQTEIDTGEHSLLALQQACTLTDSINVRFSALMHELGKGTTPKSEWPSHHNHEKQGIELIRALCLRLTVPSDTRDLALLVCQYHSHCHTVFELKPETLLKTLESLDAFRRPERFAEYLLSCTADAEAGTSVENTPYTQANYFREALKCAQKITAKPLLEQGLHGAELGKALRRERIQALDTFKNQHMASNQLRGQAQ